MNLARRLSTVLWLLLPLTVTAAPPEPDATSPNAAARYFALFEALEPEFAKQAQWLRPDGESFAIEEYDELEFTAEDVRRGLEARQTWIESLLAATALPECDLGLELEPFGEFEIMPQPPAVKIQPFRWAHAILIADAHRVWAEGDADRATARLEASLRLINHLCGQPNAMALWPIVSGHLLKKSMSSCSLLLRSTRGNLLTRSHRDRLLAAASAFTSDDPVRSRAARSAEAARFIDFAARELADGEIGEPLLIELARVRTGQVMADNLFQHLLKKAGAEKLGALSGGEPRDVLTEAAKQSDHFTHETLSARLERAREIERSLDAVWTATDADTQLRAIDDECDADESGVLYCASFGQRSAWRLWMELRDQLEQVRAELKRDPAGP